MTRLHARRVFPAVLVSLGVAGAGAGAAGLLPHDQPERVAAGAAIYAEHCAACHGADLEGEPDWRERDAEGYLPAPPHDATGHTWHHPDAQLIEITRRGIEAMVGGGYRSKMIGFGDVLSDRDILDVLGYIKSTWPAHIRAQHDRINRDASGGN